jgi:hypothetical protein
VNPLLSSGMSSGLSSGDDSDTRRRLLRRTSTRRPSVTGSPKEECDEQFPFTTYLHTELFEKTGNARCNLVTGLSCTVMIAITRTGYVNDGQKQRKMVSIFLETPSQLER